jgi:hypothetical protein
MMAWHSRFGEFVYKGFSDAKNLADLYNRVAMHMAENRNMKPEII